MDIKGAIAANWKTWLKTYGPYVLALLIGIAAGWYAKPDVVKIEEREKIVEVEKKVDVIHNVEVVKEVVKYVTVKDTSVDADVHKERVETRLPDGTVTIKETTDTSVKKDTKEGTELDDDKKDTKVTDATETDDKSKVTEKEKIVTPMLAQWHLGVLVGVSPVLPNIAESPVMFGLEAERRIVGPLFLGVWAMAGTPVVGVPKLSNPTLGVKLAMEF